MKITQTDKQIGKIVKQYFAKGQTEADIPAVLKYIKNYEDDIFFNMENNNIEFIILDNEEGYPNNCSIPNKLLHLYTEEEKKELLEILKKLNK